MQGIKVLIVCILIVMMLIMAQAVLAQDEVDDTPVNLLEVIAVSTDPVIIQIVEPDAVPTELLTVEQSNELTSALGRSLQLGALIGTPLVLILTQGTKFISYADRFKGENIALFWSAIIVLAGTLAFSSGYGDLFDTSYSTLSGLAQPFVMGLTSFAGAGLVYNKVIKSATGDKMGLLSKSRTPGA